MSRNKPTPQQMQAQVRRRAIALAERRTARAEKKADAARARRPAAPIYEPSPAALIPSLEPIVAPLGAESADPEVAAFIAAHGVTRCPTKGRDGFSRGEINHYIAKRKEKRNQHLARERKARRHYSP